MEPLAGAFGAMMSLGPLMVDVQGLSLTEEDRVVLRHPLVGSVILFTRNYRDPGQLAALVAEIHAVRSPPLLVAVDHEGGRVQRFRSGFSRLPPLRRIGHVFDADPADGLEMARKLGWLMAAELLAVGIDFSFAPCIDLDYGVSEIIGDRAFHSGSARVGELAVAYMHGMRDAGMAATAKHFPGHGAVVADSHLALPVDRRELADMEPDLAPYRLLIANGLPAVMVAHVLVPAVDDVPASFSRRWVQGLLRGELRFQGAVFADDLSMAGAVVAGDIVQRAGRALAAGCDVLPVCNARASVLELLERLEVSPDPTSGLRLVRMRGRRHGGGLDALSSDPLWQTSQEWLARSQGAPELKLEAGNS
ncbi:MAG: beta-N-acetylhexosaminidase [Steroidobacteraceae bacterium]